jgi:peroxiredoxin
VLGRACLTCADIVAQRYLDPYGGGQTALRERAIRLYQRVIDEYSDITHWDGESISVLAENQLFELKELQVGAQAPEIEGVDLAGKPMKLSEYRGKVVVIHYWQSSLAFFDDLKRISRDYRDKPLVILGVTTDKDRAEALATATSKLQGLAIRHWHDPDRKIHARWSGSWPCTQVIGHDGKILYKGQRKSRTPLDDVLDEAVTAAESSHPRSAVTSD